MQSYYLNLGKTKAELQALTDITDLGDMIYDPGKKIAYEKEWHTITPTTVIKPEIDGTELDYYYNKTKLAKNKKYCAQLYWKAGLVITDGTTSDMITPTGTIGDSYIGRCNFNSESGLVDSIFYARGKASSGQTVFASKSFATSEELATLLDVTNIRATLKKIPSLQTASPTTGNNYLYNGTKSYTVANTGMGFNVQSNTNIYTPITTMFGHPVAGNNNKDSYITVIDDDDPVELDYSQPESNIDDETFYDFGNGTMDNDTPDYIKTYYPQALPLGVPMVIAPAYNTTNTHTTTTDNLKTFIAPFIFYMLGVTEVPGEA